MRKASLLTLAAMTLSAAPAFAQSNVFIGPAPPSQGSGDSVATSAAVQAKSNQNGLTLGADTGRQLGSGNQIVVNSGSMPAGASNQGNRGVQANAATPLGPNQNTAAGAAANPGATGPYVAGATLGR